MNKMFQPFHLGKYLSLMIFSFFLVACANSMSKQLMELGASPEKISAFTDQLKSLKSTISENPDYKKIPLDTEEDKNWFTTLAYQYWNDEIGLSEFVSQGVARFPGYEESFNFVAEKLKS